MIQIDPHFVRSSFPTTRRACCQEKLAAGTLRSDPGCSSVNCSPFLTTAAAAPATEAAPVAGSGTGAGTGGGAGTGPGTGTGNAVADAATDAGTAVADAATDAGNAVADAATDAGNAVADAATAAVPRDSAFTVGVSSAVAMGALVLAAL